MINVYNNVLVCQMLNLEFHGKVIALVVSFGQNT